MNNKNIAMMGAALLVLGAFAPIASMPIVGSVTPIQDGRGLGWVWLAFAGLAAYYAAREESAMVSRAGKGAMVVAVAWMIFMLFRLADVRSSVTKAADGNPFGGISEAAVAAIHFEWGWAALIVGAGMLIYAGGAAEKHYICPKCKGMVFEGDDDCASCGSLLRWVRQKVFLRPRPSPGAVVQPAASLPPPSQV